MNPVTPRIGAVEYADPKIDLARLRSWKEGVVKKLTGGLGVLSKQRKVEYIQGRAAFENSNTLRISKAGGGEREPELRSHHPRYRLPSGDYSQRSSWTPRASWTPRPLWI